MVYDTRNAHDSFSWDNEVLWGHCIVKDSAGRELWRCEIERGQRFPDDLMERVLADPDVAGFHIGTRRWYTPWVWECQDGTTAGDWPQGIAHRQNEQARS